MNFSPLIKRRFAFLGIYQIAGGIVGLLLVTWYFIQVNVFSGIYLWAPLLAFPFFGYSIYCGILLLQKKESGLRLSFVNQCLQLFGFVFFGYGFKYVSGVFLAVGIDLTNSVEFGLNFGISTWQININSEDTSFLINFNLVALYLVIFITKLQRRIETERMAHLMELDKEETEPLSSSS